MTEQRHVDEDLAVEVALGQADGPVRDRVTAHLAVCERCRRDYDELAAAVELVLPAVPRRSPPPGFEGGVLARLEEERGALPRLPASRHTARRRTALVAVAAGLVGLAAGAGLGVGLAGRDADTEPPPAATAPWAAPLLDASGTRVGTVSRSYGAAGPVLVVDVTGGAAGRSYTCRLVLEGGTRRDVADWELSADRPNSWVVPDPGARGVELVGTSGRVWSVAEL